MCIICMNSVTSVGAGKMLLSFQRLFYNQRKYHATISQGAQELLAVPRSDSTGLMNSRQGCPSIHPVHTVGTFRPWSDGKSTWSQISELEHWIAVSHTESLRAAFVPLVSERWRRNSRLQFSLTHLQKCKIHVHWTFSPLWGLSTDFQTMLSW